MFRHDYRINPGETKKQRWFHWASKMFLPFSRSTGQATERQKVSSIIERCRSLIAPINSDAREKASIVDFPDLFALKRNCVFSASSGSREINQVNPVNPVGKYFGFMSNDLVLILMRNRFYIFDF